MRNITRERGAARMGGEQKGKETVFFFFFLDF